MKKLYSVMFVAALALLVSANAFAWTWSGAENGDFNGQQTYNQIDVFWSSGDQFSVPTFTNLSSTWQNFSDANSAIEAVAYGNATNGYTNYSLNFSGSDNTSTVLYQISLGSDVKGRGVYTFTSSGGVSGSIFTGSDKEWYALGGKAPTAVPEPVSTVLFISGGTLLAVRRMRRANK